MSVFKSVWELLSSEFDLSKCIYKIINGRVFIHFPKIEDSFPIRVKVTRNAQEDKDTLYEALDSVIVSWLSNSTPSNENVYSRLGPNKTYYYIINFTVYNYVYESGIDEPIIDCTGSYNEDLSFDDDWNCDWEDEDDPESYEIDINGVKSYKWTKNWANTFEEDFD